MIRSFTPQERFLFAVLMWSVGITTLAMIAMLISSWVG